MTKREMAYELRRMRKSVPTECKSIYIGSYLSLDPCGRYHHVISPNGITRRCELYCERLEAAADMAGGWIESREGDALDIYFSW